MRSTNESVGAASAAPERNQTPVGVTDLAFSPFERLDAILAELRTHLQSVSRSSSLMSGGRRDTRLGAHHSRNLLRSASPRHFSPLVRAAFIRVGDPPGFSPIARAVACAEPIDAAHSRRYRRGWPARTSLDGGRCGTFSQ